MQTVVSVVIPTLNERETIVATLSTLEALRRSGHEVVLVDGGSTDGTTELARPLTDRLLSSPPGRALQLNAGARAASGDTLLFLHADTLLAADAREEFLDGFPRSPSVWGWFDVELTGRQFMLRVVETLMNSRSRVTRIATGDHAIFVERRTFDKVGGYPEIPLMEDIAISRLLKREGRPYIPRRRIVTSSRRWEEKGIWKTILLMWRLRLAYALGAAPERLAESYYSGPPDPPPSGTN